MARPGKNNPTGAQKSPRRTPEVLRKLEQAFAMGCTNPEACFYAGIGESTFYEWMQDEPKLSERLKALKNKPILKARTTLIRDLDDVSTAKWYLERKLKNEFAQRTESTGANGEPIQFKHSLSDEDLEAIIASNNEN